MSSNPRQALPGNRRIANRPISAPASVLTRADVECIVARDLATPAHRLKGLSRRAVLMRDRRALVVELNAARAENAQLRARIAQLEVWRLIDTHVMRDRQP
jgi:hypothetical protein